MSIISPNGIKAALKSSLSTSSAKPPKNWETGKRNSIDNHNNRRQRINDYKQHTYHKPQYTQNPEQQIRRFKYVEQKTRFEISSKWQLRVELAHSGNMKARMHLYLPT